jgi:hypothetical protein
MKFERGEAVVLAKGTTVNTKYEVVHIKEKDRGVIVHVSGGWYKVLMDKYQGTVHIPLSLRMVDLARTQEPGPFKVGDHVETAVDIGISCSKFTMLKKKLAKSSSTEIFMDTINSSVHGSQCGLVNEGTYGIVTGEGPPGQVRVAFLGHEVGYSYVKFASLSKSTCPFYDGRVVAATRDFNFNDKSHSVVTGDRGITLSSYKGVNGRVRVKFDDAAHPVLIPISCITLSEKPDPFQPGDVIMNKDVLLDENKRVCVAACTRGIVQEVESANAIPGCIWVSFDAYETGIQGNVQVSFFECTRTTKLPIFTPGSVVELKSDMRLSGGEVSRGDRGVVDSVSALDKSIMFVRMDFRRDSKSGLLQVKFHSFRASSKRGPFDYVGQTIALKKDVQLRAITLYKGSMGVVADNCVHRVDVPNGKVLVIFHNRMYFLWSHSMCTVGEYQRAALLILALVRRLVNLRKCASSLIAKRYRTYRMRATRCRRAVVIQTAFRRRAARVWLRRSVAAANLFQHVVRKRRDSRRRRWAARKISIWVYHRLKARDRAEKVSEVPAFLTECVVCMDAPPTHLAAPCGHLCICATCSSDLSACPYCMTPVTCWVKLFRV